MSMYKGPEAGGIVKLSGHQKRSLVWWSIKSKPEMWSEMSGDSGFTGTGKDFVLYPRSSGMNLPLMSVALSRLPTCFSLD